MSFIADRVVMDGLTFDDVLLIPATFRATASKFSKVVICIRSFRFFVTFGAVHVLKLVSLLQSKVMPALLNICLLIALVLLTVPSKTPLFR